MALKSSYSEMHDDISTSSLTADEGLKMKYQHWPKMNIFADMTGR